MLGLPAHPGLAGTLLLALGGVLGATVLVAAWRLRARLDPTPVSGIVAAALAATVAVTLGVAPFVCWRVVEDLRYTTRLTRAQAEGIGGDENHLDRNVFQRLAALIPRDATYYVTSSPAADRKARLNLDAWAAYSLLPRIPVTDSRKASWIVTVGLDPHRIGLPLGPVTVLKGIYGQTYYAAPRRS